jgi:hypothetical protein
MIGPVTGLRLWTQEHPMDTDTLLVLKPHLGEPRQRMSLTMTKVANRRGIGR